MEHGEGAPAPLLVLGSASVARRALLGRLGVPFRVEVAGIDERAIRHDDPVALADALALAKAQAVAARIGPGNVVLGADSVVVCAGRLHEKPADRAEAHAMWRCYGQHPLQVVSALAAVETATGRVVTGREVATLRVRPVPPAVVDAMLDGGAAASAGALVVEDPHLQPYLESLDGTREGVMGLPLAVAAELLRALGVAVPAPPAEEGPTA